MNKKGLGKKISISHDNYISALIETFLIFRCEIYEGNHSSRAVGFSGSPKSETLRDAFMVNKIQGFPLYQVVSG